MQKRKRKSGRGASTIFLVLVLVVCAGIIYWYLNNRSANEDVVVKIINEKSTKVQELNKTKDEVTAHLEDSNSSGRYGIWPIQLSDINLSLSRGNPFAEKRTATIDQAIDSDLSSDGTVNQLNN